MYRFRLPLTDWDVLLAPRWSEFSVLGQVAALLGCILVPIILVLWLYRYELKLVRMRTAVVLLMLRLLVVLSLLLVVCFQPIVAHSTTLDLPGRVLLAIDQSVISMLTD